MTTAKLKAKVEEFQGKKTTTEEDVQVLARENAATKIQRAWRAKRRASYLGTDFLWTDLVTHARFKLDRDAAAQGKNAARDRWRRAIFLTLRLQDGNTMLADERVEYADASRKWLETQHWLEMIDVLSVIFFFFVCGWLYES
ncbi:hypothetical protein BC835DRAFT_1286057 [Cytidiella melzeri]|nr:hypothetical protein BC835DRAFT_1286057 [Cytidiella melzeri]